MERHRLLIGIGLAGVIFGAQLAVDPRPYHWPLLVILLGAVALTAGLAAWAIIGDTRSRRE